MIDTRQSRVEIGFHNSKYDWVNDEAKFDEHTLKIGGHPVMEDWERGYMERLVETVTQKGGAILELGYGMGISAREIQKRKIANHFVIECHPDVVRVGIKEMRFQIQHNKIHFIQGFWEDVTPFLAPNTYDGILFDTYPLSEKEIHSNHFWFFREAFRLLKPGGIFTYYSDEVEKYSKTHFQKLIDAGFKKEKITSEICKVFPPEDCEYWQAKQILVPIVIK